jgi:hypothetical protein
MKPLKSILLLLAFTLPGSIVLCASRPWPDSWSKSNDIQIDGNRFSALPSDEGNDAIREHARRFMKRGGTLMMRSSAPRDRHQSGLPNVFRIEHEIRFGSDREIRKIGTGAISKNAGEKLFSGSEGWEYHEGEAGSRIAMAINNQGGRKSIVLIDRNRNTFLSISN